MLWRLLLNSGSGAERGRITEVCITEDNPGDIVCVNLRFYGAEPKAELVSFLVAD